MIEVTHNGRMFAATTAIGLAEMGVPAEVVDAAISVKKKKDGRNKIRAAITKEAGDTASLLGVTSDAAALAIYGLASLVSKLATANSLAEVREAAEPFAELSAGFLAKVESGEVVLPFMLKGIDTVVSDIETRATKVSEALKSVQEG